MAFLTSFLPIHLLLWAISSKHAILKPCLFSIAETKELVAPISTENIVPTQTLTPSLSNQSAALAASGVMTEPKILPWLDPSLTRDQAQAVWEEYHLDNF